MQLAGAMIPMRSPRRSAGGWVAEAFTIEV
jgi:hypothetical protein